jgi:Leu/Phe-tRNA-protein transferase
MSAERTRVVPIEPETWSSPHPKRVLYLNDLHITHSLQFLFLSDHTNTRSSL